MSEVPLQVRCRLHSTPLAKGVRMLVATKTVTKRPRQTLYRGTSLIRNRAPPWDHPRPLGTGLL